MKLKLSDWSSPAEFLSAIPVIISFIDAGIQLSESTPAVRSAAVLGRWAKRLVESACIQEGSRVLDVICGTGVLARTAVARAGALDCVLTQFGLMFFQVTTMAAKEMFQVLKPGVLLGIAVWRSVHHNTVQELWRGCAPLLHVK